MDSVWLPKPVLEGELVILRPFTADDAEVMGRIFADPDVLRLTGTVTTSAEIAASKYLLA